MRNKEIIDMFSVGATCQAKGYKGKHIIVLVCGVPGCKWYLPTPGWTPCEDPTDDEEIQDEFVPALFKHLKEDHKFMRFKLEPNPFEEG